ncbi:DUF1634 domain-containing protein [Peptococcaceae bacterium 1198_IL3148]
MANSQLAKQQVNTAVTNQPLMNVPAEQVAYAKMINYGQWLGLAVLVVTFLLYVTGMVPGMVHPSEIAQNWHLSAHEYLEVTGSPTGWEWLGMLNYGNFLSLLGVAWLGGLTIIAYLIFLVPAYLKQKDIAFFTIAITEVIVLVVAASGILGSAGH